MDEAGEMEYLAFTQTVIYHWRSGPRDCKVCGELPLGSSFADHLWNVFTEARGR